MPIAKNSAASGSGGGSVTSVTSANTGIAVANPTTTPVLTIGSLATIASNHASAGAITASSQKITNLAVASASTDAASLANTLDQFGAPAANVSINSHKLTSVLGTIRVVTAVTQSATPTINTDNIGWASITGLAQAITSMTTNLSGTPVAGQSLIIQLTDDGTGRAIAWGASFESSTVTLPTTTVASTLLTVGFFWNTVTTKWRCVAVA